MSSALFSPLELRGLTLNNRLVVSSMCQYAAENGSAVDWHLMHLGQFPIGAAGLVMTEATAVSAVGSITPKCLGLYGDENEAALKRVGDFCRKYGVTPVGVQLAHAGRKGSAQIPLDGGKLENRRRYPPEVFEAARAAWPEDKPLGIRISATDWIDGGWTVEESVVFARELKSLGCDFIDVSSGALDPRQKIPLGSGYQVPFSDKIRKNNA